MSDLLWPFESNDVLSTRIEPYIEDIGKRELRIYRLMAQSAAARGQRKTALEQELQREGFATQNSPFVTIEGKLKFTEIARELGYLAPASVLIHGAPTSQDAQAVVDLDPSPQRLCKPLDGRGGRGLHITQSPQEALSHAVRCGQPTLVQRFLPPVHGDLRYILHRTVRDLREKAPPSVRMAVERLGPVVDGDGRSTITELIGRLRPRWPVVLGDINSPLIEIIDCLCPRTRVGKMKLMMGVEQDRVLGRGERLRLVGSGNITFPKSARLPSRETLEILDPFMLRFLADFEQRIGGVIATLCVDMGVTHGWRPVLYEWQCPSATPLAYPLGIPKQSAVRKAFHRSTLCSGSYLRTIQS